MEIELRPYLIACEEAIKSRYDAGVTEQLIVEATGLGKRIQAVYLMRHFKRSLFLCHREELILQAYNEINYRWPMQVGIIKGPVFELDKRIVVGSVQTMCNRLGKIDPSTFDLIIVDEGHHYVSPTFLKTIRHFTPKLRTVWTATPRRLDGISMTNIAQEIVFEYRIENGIKDGWLCEIEAYQIKTQADLTGIKRTAGDFNQKELSERVDSRSRNALIAMKYLQYAKGRQGIAYCVDMDHAYNLRDILREHGIKSETIVSDTVRCPNRKDILNRFKMGPEGEIEILTNCEILCLDFETEILTNNGWRKHDKILSTDKVANWSYDNTIYFKEPFEIVKRDLYPTEFMVSVKNKMTDIRTTNTHRIIHKSDRNCLWEKSPAETLLNKTWRYPSAGNCIPQVFLIDQEKTTNIKRSIASNAYTLRKKNGLSHSESIITATERLNNRINKKYKNPDELSNDECELIGFWIGDGSINKSKRQGLEYTLCQSKKYSNIVNEIDSLLLRLGLHNIKRDKGEHYVWSINRGTGRIISKLGMYEYEPYLNKNGTNLFWGFNQPQFESFIYGFWLADGLHHNLEKIPESKRISNTNYNLMSLLQSISVCRNMNASITIGTNHKKNKKFKEIYNLNIEQRNERNIKSKDIRYLMIKEEYKQEQVWCVKTETKNIITRRNGKVCIMGNTEGYDYSDVGCILEARPTQSETLYVQTIGRGTRLKSQGFKDRFGENNCIVLDFVDNSGKLSVMNAYELEKNLPIEDRMFMPKEQKEKLLLAIKERRERMIKQEATADRKINLLILPEVRVWNSEKMLESASEKQIKWLRDINVWQEDVEYTKAMASELISSRPAEEWQIRWLAERKYDVDEGCSLGQYQRVKYAYEIKNKYAIDNADKAKILKQLNGDTNL